MEQDLNKLSGTLPPTVEAENIEDEFSSDDLVDDSSESSAPPSPDEEEEIGLDAFQGQDYIKVPEVGDTIEFTVDKIVKNPVIEGTNKTTGEKFTIGCKKKDGTVVRNDIITTDNERFTIGSWGLFYLFFDRKGEFAAEVVERGGPNGIVVSIRRNHDGSVPNKKTSDVMKLYNLPTAEDAEAYKKEVAKAVKDGGLFTMEILKKGD